MVDEADVEDYISVQPQCADFSQCGPEPSQYSSRRKLDRKSEPTTETERHLIMCKEPAKETELYNTTEPEAYVKSDQVCEPATSIVSVRILVEYEGMKDSPTHIPTTEGELLKLFDPFFSKLSLPSGPVCLLPWLCPAIAFCLHCFPQTQNLLFPSQFYLALNLLSPCRFRLALKHMCIRWFCPAINLLCRPIISTMDCYPTCSASFPHPSGTSLDKHPCQPSTQSHLHCHLSSPHLTLSLPSLIWVRIRYSSLILRLGVRIPCLHLQPLDL